MKTKDANAMETAGPNGHAENVNDAQAKSIAARKASARLTVINRVIRSSEKEISHGRVSWQTL